MLAVNGKASGNPLGNTSVIFVRDSTMDACFGILFRPFMSSLLVSLSPFSFIDAIYYSVSFGLLAKVVLGT